MTPSDSSAGFVPNWPESLTPRSSDSTSGLFQEAIKHTRDYLRKDKEIAEQSIDIPWEGAAAMWQRHRLKVKAVESLLAVSRNDPGSREALTCTLIAAMLIVPESTEMCEQASTSLQSMVARHPDTWQGKFAPLIQCRLVKVNSDLKSFRERDKNVAQRRLAILEAHLPAEDYRLDLSQPGVDVLYQLYRSDRNLRFQFLLRIAGHRTLLAEYAEDADDKAEMEDKGRAIYELLISEAKNEEPIKKTARQALRSLDLRVSSSATSESNTNSGPSPDTGE
jgi:hypothetical protein